MAESGHWYDMDGRLVLEVPYADPRKGMRAPTLADARKMALRPSVTTVIQLVANPVLLEWIKKEVAKAAIKYPKSLFTGEEEHIQRLLEGADEYRNWAAEFGTNVHGQIAGWFRGLDLVGDEPEAMVAKGFADWYKSSGLELERSEHSFVSPYGYAGTIDFLGTHNGVPVIADFKTQDFEDPKEANFYDSWGLQLSGYAAGTANLHRERMSIVISRSIPGLVVTHMQRDAEKLKYDRAWMSLWQFWQDMKDYYPEGKW